MKIVIAIFILGIIVIIHELGHFLLAKKNGITVTEFSIGMGPRIASFVKHGTRYSLKLFPIGGSCMMLGEDEAVEDEGAFDKKGVWARFSVIFAGAFFNFLFAFILALILLGNTGVDMPVVTKVEKQGSAYQSLQSGDVITKINGSPIHFSRDIDYYFMFTPLSDKPVNITYTRDGEKNSVKITPKWRDYYQLGCGYTPASKIAMLEEVYAGYPLEKAGLAVGDVIIAVDGAKISTAEDFAAYFNNNPLTGKEVSLSYLKGGKGDPITVKITPKLVQSSYNMGVNYNTFRQKVSALKVIEYSFYEIKLNIVNTLKGILYLITGKFSVKDMAGPVGIVNMVGTVVSESKGYGIKVLLLSLVQFSILISANLGVMNLLPLPALDGGRLVFLLIEVIRRKPVPKEKEAMVHMVGMVLLMLLMVFVMYNDIRNLMG